jgi:hypothetical protein
MFPTVCVDEFYENPDEILDWALTLDYDNSFDSSGLYPGIRTKPLHELDQNFFNKFTKKFMSIYYDFGLDPNIKWNCYTAFHKIYPQNKHQNSIANTGWIHHDKCAVAGVIYFNKPNFYKSGTNLYRLKDSCVFSDVYDPLEHIKIKMYKLKTPEQLSSISEEDIVEHDKALSVVNSQFDETASFSSVYNRMVAYDGTSWHAANNFSTATDFRLTQVFFFYDVTASSFPLQRLRNA